MFLSTPGFLDDEAGLMFMSSSGSMVMRLNMQFVCCSFAISTSDAQMLFLYL